MTTEQRIAFVRGLRYAAERVWRERDTWEPYTQPWNALRSVAEAIEDRARKFERDGSSPDE